VQQSIKNSHNLDVDLLKVKHIMKKDLGLSYRIAKKVPIQSNSERCLVQRQQYAFKILELLHDDWRVINIDESWINETNYTRMMWSPTSAPNTMISKAVAPRLALIAALDTDGKVYYSLTQANTDSDVMMLFMVHLIE